MACSEHARRMRQAAASPRWARTWGNCPVAGAHRDRATSQRNSQIELDVGGLEPTFGLPACQHIWDASLPIMDSAAARHRFPAVGVRCARFRGGGGRQASGALRSGNRRQALVAIFRFINRLPTYSIARRRLRICSARCLSIQFGLLGGVGRGFFMVDPSLG
jgi:hypothetical protein